ncbi:MAG TPA: hypothetical protein VK928_05800 [Longimicrobiales bacterium]|nr:hypothetical protein [Longimicrobiales bacterium]
MSGDVGASESVRARRAIGTTSGAERFLDAGLLLVWIAAAYLPLAAGAPFYLTPFAERAFSPQHGLYSPSGVVGHGLGILGSGMVAVGVTMYSVRKRWAGLHSAGKLKYWLKVHIFLCTLGPFLVVLHTSFKFGGIVSIALWSMLVVVASGVFGRYVYVRIPKTINGQFQTLAAVRGAREELAGVIGAVHPVMGADLLALVGPDDPLAPDGSLAALAYAAGRDRDRREAMRRARRLLRGAAMPQPVRERLLAIVEEEHRLVTQIALLQPFQRLFRYWHILHLPLAIVMFLVLALHVTVVALFGYGWPF